MKQKILITGLQIALAAVAHTQPAINYNSASANFIVSLPAAYPAYCSNYNVCISTHLPKTSTVLEYGDGNYTRLLNTQHSSLVYNSPTLAVATTYYDTIRKREQVMLMPGMSEASNVNIETELPASQKIGILPYVLSNSIANGEKAHFIVSYRKPAKCIVAVFYNDKNAPFFQNVNSGDDTMKIADNSNNYNPVKLVRVHQQQKVDTSFYNLYNSLPGNYQSRLWQACSDYVSINRKYMKAVFIADSADNGNGPRNIFLSLKSVDFSQSGFNYDTVSNLKVVLIPLSNDAVETSGTSLIYTLQSHDPNNAYVNPSCVAFENAAHQFPLKLHFTVNFQNTGSADVDKIIVKHTLPKGLDADSISIKNFIIGGNENSSITSNRHVPGGHTTQPGVYCEKKIMYLKSGNILQLTFYYKKDEGNDDPMLPLLTGTYQNPYAFEDPKTMGKLQYDIVLKSVTTTATVGGVFIPGNSVKKPAVPDKGAKSNTSSNAAPIIPSLNCNNKISVQFHTKGASHWEPAMMHTVVFDYCERMNRVNSTVGTH